MYQSQCKKLYKNDLVPSIGRIKENGMALDWHFSLCLNWQIYNDDLRSHTAWQQGKRNKVSFTHWRRALWSKSKCSQNWLQSFIILEINLNLLMRIKFTTCSTRQLWIKMIRNNILPNYMIGQHMFKDFVGGCPV